MAARSFIPPPGLIVQNRRIVRRGKLAFCQPPTVDKAQKLHHVISRIMLISVSVQIPFQDFSSAETANNKAMTPGQTRLQILLAAPIIFIGTTGLFTAGQGNQAGALVIESAPIVPGFLLQPPPPARHFLEANSQCLTKLGQECAQYRHKHKQASLMICIFRKFKTACKLPYIERPSYRSKGNAG